MTESWMTWAMGIAGLALLAAAVPYVARIRHPDQRPFAAYLIFVSVFLTAAIVLFALLSWLAGIFDLAHTLESPLVALLYVLLIFLPAAALGAWQARRPPIRRGPPE